MYDNSLKYLLNKFNTAHCASKLCNSIYMNRYIVNDKPISEVEGPEIDSFLSYLGHL